MATTFNIRPLTLPPTYTVTQAPTFDMGTVLNQSGVGTGTYSTGNLSVVNFKGCTVILNVSADSGQTLNVQILGVDPTSNNTWTLLATTGGMTGTGTTAHTLYPGLTTSLGITTTTNSYQNGILPTLIQIAVVTSVGGTSSFTVDAILTT